MSRSTWVQSIPPKGGWGSYSIHNCTIRAVGSSVSRATSAKARSIPAYRAAANGQLPTLAFGRRLFVPTVRLLEMLGFPIEEEP